MSPNTIQGELHSIIYVLFLTKNVYPASKHEKTIRQIQLTEHHTGPRLFKRESVIKDTHIHKRVEIL